MNLASFTVVTGQYNDEKHRLCTHMLSSYLPGRILGHIWYEYEEIVRREPQQISRIFFIAHSLPWR